jgi:hypothetical protein
MAAFWPTLGLGQTYAQLPSAQSVQPPAARWARVIARSSGRVMADLYVDGRATCRLPCQPLLPVGVHRFEGRGVAGTSAPQSVYLPPGATVPLFFDVMPAQASIRVATADPNTVIYMDGNYVGKGTWQGVIAPGRHALLLRKSTGEVLQQALDTASGMNYTIRDNETPKPPAAPPVPPSGQPPLYTPQTSPNAAAQSYGPAISQPPQPNSTLPHKETVDPAFRGITGAVFAPLILGGPSTNKYGSSCPATDFGGTCATSGPRGGAIALQLGYSYGWIAPVAMLGLSLDVSSAGLQLPADFQITGDTAGMLAQIAGDTKFMRLGILGGLGARASTLAQGRRYTFSGVLGYVKRNVYIIPDSFFGSKPSYWAPTLFFDGGVVFGETPGVKVYAGLFLWLEFIPSLTISRDVTKVGLLPEYVPESLRTITPFSGTQIMFGPLIGVTFGH